MKNIGLVVAGFLILALLIVVASSVYVVNETVQVVFQGLRRIHLDAILQTEPYYRFRVAPVKEREPRGSDVDGSD